MQDFNYLFSNCLEISVLLSCCRHPPRDTLQGHWEDNMEALLSFLEAAQTGVRGLVTSEAGTPLAGAQVQVEGIDKNVTTSKYGEYWRILAPGHYR